MKHGLLTILTVTVLILGCNEQKSKENNKQTTDKLTTSVSDSLASCAPNLTGSTTNEDNSLEKFEIQSLTKVTKQIDSTLPTIGILMYDKVLMTELTAPMDVFAKHSENGKQLFNVITIAENYNLFTIEEGLKMFPDYIFANAPKLDIIIVPSA